ALPICRRGTLRGADDPAHHIAAEDERQRHGGGKASGAHEGVPRVDRGRVCCDENVLRPRAGYLERAVGDERGGAELFGVRGDRAHARSLRFPPRTTSGLLEDGVWVALLRFSNPKVILERREDLGKHREDLSERRERSLQRGERSLQRGE